jgi:hypothetical protein
MIVKNDISGNIEVRWERIQPTLECGHNQHVACLVSHIPSPRMI